MEDVTPAKLLQDYANTIHGADSNDLARSTVEFRGQRATIRQLLDVTEGEAIFLHGFLERELDHSKFFLILEHLVEFFGFSDDTNQIVGRLWLAVLQKTSSDEIEKNLTTFSDLGHSLWTMLPAFEIVLASLPLHPKFASTLLTHLAQRTANDYANGLFWNAVHCFVKQQCSLAIQVLSELMKSGDTYGLALASFFMGTLRHLRLPIAEIGELRQIEADCSQHPTLELRTVFLQSWGTTSWQAGINDAQLETLFARYVDAHDEQQEIIVVISRIAWSRGASVDTQSKAITWLRPRAVDARASKAKCAVVELVSQRLDKSKKAQAIEVDLFCSIFPLPVSDTSTWSIVEPYLVRLIELDLDCFCSLLMRIIESDAENVFAAFRDSERLDWLTREMAKRNVSPLVSQIIFSATRSARRLGLYLFDELEIESISGDVLKTADAATIMIAFYESQCVLISGESLSKLFVSLIRTIDLMEADFQSDFYAEVFLQCQNRAASVQKGLQQLIPTHSIISQILNETANCGTQIREARESNIAMMAVTGYEQAGRMSQRRTAEVTSRSMEKHSPLLQLCKKVNLLYANVNSSYVDGHLNPASKLHQFSTSVEVPTIDFADPEGMAIRRWRASTRIAELQRQSDSRQSDDD